MQTPGRKRPANGASTRRILAVKNSNNLCPDDSVYSQANFSLASTGSYTDFQVCLVQTHTVLQSLLSCSLLQRGLHGSLDTHKSARSSTLPKSSSTQNLARK